MNAPARDQATSPLAPGFRLGLLRILPKTGEVIGPAGAETLDPKVVDVLVMLAEDAGRTVSRERLLARLWPNVVVTDEALSRCVYELRRQLSIAGGDETLRTVIETLPKRGYRLNADIVPLEPSAPTTLWGRRRRVIAAACIAATAIAVAVVLWTLASKGDGKTPSVAVLPFVDMSATRDQAYLADGVAEEILDKLNNSTDLRVIARTSSFTFRGRNADIQAIARKLEVTHVLEGSVRRTGDNLRITAQLIATSDSSHVWSTTFERKLGDLFAIQDEIAAAVASALDTSLRLGSSRPRPMPNMEAYDLAKQGEYFHYRRAAGDTELAVERLERAVRIDPGFARAWAVLAGVYSFQAWLTDPPSRALQARQGNAALRAVELDPALPLAQARLAEYYEETGDEAASARHFALARESGRDEPLVLGYMAQESMQAGDYAAAVELHRLAVARDPMGVVPRQLLTVALIAGDQLDEALANQETMVEIHPDANPDYVIEIPRILALQGRYDRAVPAALRLPAGKYRDQAMSLMRRAPGYAEDADAALARLEVHVPVHPLDRLDDTIMDAVRLAESHAFRGDRDRAFGTLMKELESLEGRQESGVYMQYLRYESRLSPFLKSLHADPRWAAFMADSA